MNENIDLVKILKNCPSGTTFWSKLHGKVIFKGIEEDETYFPIRILYRNYSGYAHEGRFSKEGFCMDFSGECLLVPSKEQQDWSKVRASWLKKPKFDPKTLQPFDKVLVKDHDHTKWKIDFFSHIDDDNKLKCLITSWKLVIPYNKETKHLVGTSNEAPEYYRYWED